MGRNLPIVAQPGSATVSSVRREEGQAAYIRRKQYASARRESRRASFPMPHRIFVGYTLDPRSAESLLKPEIAWCERNCNGLWTISYGSFQQGLGYTIRFGFTREEDATAFAGYRRHRRNLRESEFSGDNTP